LLPGLVTDTVELAQAIVHAGLGGGTSLVVENRRIREEARRYTETRGLS
jgi:hypothetical protein